MKYILLLFYIYFITLIFLSYNPLFYTLNWSIFYTVLYYLQQKCGNFIQPWDSLIYVTNTNAKYFCNINTVSTTGSWFITKYPWRLQMHGEHLGKALHHLGIRQYFSPLWQCGTPCVDVITKSQYLTFEFLVKWNWHTFPFTFLLTTTANSSSVNQVLPSYCVLLTPQIYSQ